jgi:hypothetical protein
VDFYMMVNSKEVYMKALVARLSKELRNNCMNVLHINYHPSRKYPF